MEIGESNYQQVITVSLISILICFNAVFMCPISLDLHEQLPSQIIRKARWLRRDQYTRITPGPNDKEDDLDHKWKRWIYQESKKRYAALLSK